MVKHDYYCSRHYFLHFVKFQHEQQRRSADFYLSTTVNRSATDFSNLSVHLGDNVFKCHVSQTVQTPKTSQPWISINLRWSGHTWTAQLKPQRCGDPLHHSVVNFNMSWSIPDKHVISMGQAGCYGDRWMLKLTGEAAQIKLGDFISCGFFLTISVLLARHE